MADKQVQPVTPRLGINCGEGAKQLLVRAGDERPESHPVVLKSERHRSSRSWLAWLMVRRQLRGIATSLSWTICGESVRMCRWSRSHRWPSDIDMKDLLWNRRARRTIEKSTGMVLNLFAGRNPEWSSDKLPAGLDNFTQGQNMLDNRGLHLLAPDCLHWTCQSLHGRSTLQNPLPPAAKRPR